MSEAAVVLNPALADFVQRRPGQCFILTSHQAHWISPILDRLGCGTLLWSDGADGPRPASPDDLRSSSRVFALRDDFDRVVAIAAGSDHVPDFEAADIGIAFGGVKDPAAELVSISSYVTYDSRALCRLLDTL